MLVLTLTGAVMSRLVEKQISWSSDRNSTKEELIEGLQKIDTLRTEKMRLETALAHASARRRQTASDVEQARADLNASRTQISRLGQEKILLSAAIEKAGRQFAHYREEYRDSVWRDAVGEKIDHLFLTTGQQLDRVVITAVTPVGLTVSHSHGTARIPYEKLGKEYRDRFQWASPSAKRTPEP